MENFIVLIKVGNRDQSAQDVQKVLTKFGKAIKVRLGLHDFESTSSNGLIVLQVNSITDGENIKDSLKDIPEVKVEVVNI